VLSPPLSPLTCTDRTLKLIIAVLVLDEPTAWLDPGFQMKLDQIFAALPKQRQPCFSATFSSEIRSCLGELLRQIPC